MFDTNNKKENIIFFVREFLKEKSFIEVDNNIFAKDLGNSGTFTITIDYYSDKLTYIKVCNDTINKIELRISKLKLCTIINLFEAIF